MRRNIRDVKLSSPDYIHMKPDQAAEDFLQRIRHYEQAYEPITEDCTFIKLINVGKTCEISKIDNFMQSRIIFYLVNLHIKPRSIFLSRHGESELNVLGRIGGDADLSPRGKQFSEMLPSIIKENSKGKLKVWTSTLKRTIQTAQHLEYKKESLKALDEIDAGVCDGLTYEEIAKQYPEDFAARDLDKYNYRYRGGESYKDLVYRLEPVIMELERQEDVLIIGHQAVLRAVYAYFMHLKQEDLPYIQIPLHTVIKLSPRPYGCNEKRFNAHIPAVDTHRKKPQIPGEIQ